MDNSINTNYNSTSFSRRYLIIPENYEKHVLFPRKIKEAIYKNEAIKNFISDGNNIETLNLWQKLKEFFKKDEILEVTYDTCFNALNDSVIFRFGKKGSQKVKTYKMTIGKNDIITFPGYNDKKNLKCYASKHDLVIDVFTKETEKIQNFESLLSKDTTTLSRPL